MSTELTEKENDKLIEVMGELDTQLDEGYAEYGSCDENFIYLDAVYEDGEEALKLRRDMLNSKNSIKSIAESVW